MIVVADTSPILNLERIGRLELLPALYVQVLAPERVFLELSASEPFQKHSWLTIRAVEDKEAVAELLRTLDAGESEAIVLAQEVGAELLLIDERMGRRIATERGLVITGLVGVIIEAKRRGLVEEAGPIITQLVQESRFWVDRSLIRQALRSVGE